MVGVIALFIGQWITSAFTQTVLAYRAAAKGTPRTSDIAPSSKTRRTIGKFTTHIIPQKTRLLAQRQASYKALITNGSIRTVPSVKWLSSQSVICVHGHPSHFGLFADRSDYGTLDSLPDFKPVNWHSRLATAFQVRGRAINDDINNLDPDRDVRWNLGCPMCGTDQYTFEAAPLKDYVMCTASADYWWVLCHLYRRDSGMCGNCEIRRGYWAALRSLE